jgi:hypothetical protein
MEPEKIAAILLCGAALGGLTLAIIRFRDAPRPPTVIALIHGAVAASGVGTLLYVVFTREVSNLFKTSLLLFLAAALGGSAMFFGFHLRGRELPKALVLGHGLIALAGLILLLKAVFAS